MRFGFFVTVFAAVLFSVSAAAGVPTERMVDAAGVTGGLVVHVGCGTGADTTQLCFGDSWLVHGLDTDAAEIEHARARIQSLGLYGRVSVDVFDGIHLPYVDGLVNLLVCSGLGDVAASEVMRVLAPGGVAYVPHGDRWKKTVKPVPTDTDEWTHFMHDAGGNAVAQDSRAGSPRQLRWAAPPRWCRSHEFPSSVNAVVASAGRIFTIFDEAPTGVFEKLPQNCNLIARDASNGVLLWKVPMRRWQPEFGTGEGNRWNIHHTIPRRLIAEGDRVYVTLQFLDSPVSVLDAATGETLAEALPGTEGTDEMVLSDGTLVVKTTKERSVGATVRFEKEVLHDGLAAVDVGTGTVLWRHEGVRVIPYTLAVRDGRVLYHDMEDIVCLDADNGAELWRSPNLIPYTFGGSSSLVVKDGVVLFHGHTVTTSSETGKDAEKKRAKSKKPSAVMSAYSLKNGDVLWDAKGHKSWAGASTLPTEIFVVDDVVWYGNSLKGYDLYTGEVRGEMAVDNLISPGHHYRCHTAKATERFLILPKRGAEFVDVNGDEHMRNDWLRAPCFTGLTPANGLVYVPPSQCFCYPGVKVFGYLAMASGVPEPLKPSTTADVEKGPAYGKVNAGTTVPDSDWPMYRRDPMRSGSTKETVSTKLNQAWYVDLKTKGAPPVVVGDRVWVAEKDARRIRCLDAKTGEDVWHFTAGGRIDSPPTIYEGKVLFGCRDGKVYCLRATDGQLVWRFRAAPDKRTVYFEQVESVWPVQGSVLVQDGTVYFAAGHSSFLDGGIMVYGLDVNTGVPKYHHLLEGPWPDIKTDVGTPFAMEGALPDLFVSDGRDLYMQRVKFDAELNRIPVRRESPLGELDMGENHLVATGGFLDDTGFDRLYWMYSHRWPGFYFSQQSPKAGQLVVFDKNTTYAVKYFYRRHQWSPLFIPEGQGYLLFADDNDNQPALEEKGQKTALDWLPEGVNTDKHRRGGRGVEKGTGYIRQKPATWQELIPLRVRAMVLSGDRLFVAGTPDKLDPGDPFAGFEDRGEAELHVYSAKDGSLLASRSLPAPPAFDGLIVAHDRLYLSTADNRVICFSDE